MSTYAINRKKNSILYDYYWYIDVKEGISRQIFRDNNLRVHIIKVMSSSNSEYVIVQCKTRKKNKNGFQYCMSMLSNKMLLTGRKDYVKFANSVITLVNGSVGNHIIKCTGLSKNSYYVTIDVDSGTHEEFVVVPSSSDYVISECNVALRMKAMIEYNKVEYKRLKVSVRNINSLVTNVYNYVNEDVNDQQ